MDQKGKKEFLINFSFSAVVFTIVFFVLRLTFKYLTPFVLAVVIASIMQKPAILISKKTKIKKETAAAFLTVGVYILFGVLLSFVIYECIYLVSAFVSKSPYIINIFSRWSSVIYKKTENLFRGFSPDVYEEILSVFKETVENFAIKLSGSFSSFITTTAKSIPSVFISSIVALVASCYIAKDYDRLKKFLIGIISDKVHKNIARIKKIVNKSICGILKGYLLLFLITYIQLLLGLWIIRIKYAPLIALVISFVDFLPVLGTGIVLVPWGIFSIIAGNTFTGFALIILYLIMMIIRNFIEPKIIGKQMGINPLFTLFAMFLGLKLFGFLGLLLLPLALIVTYQFYSDDSL